MLPAANVLQVKGRNSPPIISHFSDMEEMGPQRGGGSCHDMVPAGDGRPEPGPMAGFSCSHMLHWGRVGARRILLFYIAEIFSSCR